MNSTDRAWTPGPWRTCGPDQFGDHAIHGPEEELAIAAVVNGVMREFGGLNEEQQANAHLIAAAPDLYEALELALPLLKEDQRKADFECLPLTKALKAISKANGATS